MRAQDAQPEAAGELPPVQPGGLEVVLPLDEQEVAGVAEDVEPGVLVRTLVQVPREEAVGAAGRPPDTRPGGQVGLGGIVGIEHPGVEPQQHDAAGGRLLRPPGGGEEHQTAGDEPASHRLWPNARRPPHPPG